MNIVITGGSGFLGRRLAETLLERGVLRGADGRDAAIRKITLVDVVPAAGFADSRVVQVTGDVADRQLLERAIDADTTSVFHLAAIVSGQAEADFDLGMRVNLDASRHLLEICRQHNKQPRIVFTSSVAVYGGDLPTKVPDDLAVTPQTSYGTQKAMAELLINDYTRRGFVDGRSLRLPTISVRPGRPNAAASSFASGIIREPLNGETSVCPVSAATRVWLLSPRTVIECFIMAHDIDGEKMGSNRLLSLPGMSIIGRRHGRVTRPGCRAGRRRQGPIRARSTDRADGRDVAGRARGDQGTSARIPERYRLRRDSPPVYG